MRRPDRPLRQREQRQRAALAAVVGAQDQTTYLSVTMRISVQSSSETMPITSLLGQPVAAGRVQRLAHGVERAGADVAVDDPDRAEHQLPVVGRRRPPLDGVARMAPSFAAAKPRDPVPPGGVRPSHDATARPRLDARTCRYPRIRSPSGSNGGSSGDARRLAAPEDLDLEQPGPRRARRAPPAGSPAPATARPSGRSRPR